MDLPKRIADALKSLFDALPLDAAMPELVAPSPAAEHARLVADALGSPELKGQPRLEAGLWLYVDDLDRSHKISQSLNDSTGSYWHGIMHRREGDFSNSHYWFNKVRRHPAMAGIPDYDPHAFIDEVEQRHAGNAPDLLERQRQEWAALFSWCAQQ